MATIERRTSKDGHLVYRAKVRRKSHPPQTATFTKRSDALKWIQITEAAILEGRHFKTAEAKHHTIADLIDRAARPWGLCGLIARLTKPYPPLPYRARAIGRSDGLEPDPGRGVPSTYAA